MKFLRPPLIIAAVLVSQVHALEPAAVTAVAAKFNDPSPAAQYNARVELNRLLDDATAPGKDDPAAVTKTLCAVLQGEDVSQEAQKYILRAMSRLATVDAVESLARLINGQDALLKEEARQVLGSIHDPKAVAVLENSLRKATDKREKMALANSLAVQKAASSVAALAVLAVDPDLEIARAGLSALASIGGDQAVSALKKANTSGKVAPAIKPDIEQALLIASSGNGQTAKEIFQSTKSDTVRLAAFIALTKDGTDSATATMIEQAVKCDDAGLRHEALKRGIEMNLPGLQSSLAQAMDQMPKEDRMVVLANIHLLKPAETAGKIALSRAASDEEDERIAAIMALGRIGTRPAFDAVLQALGDRVPPINQAAASALAAMNYPEAEAALLAKLKGDSSADKILAIKSAVFRQIPGANGILIEIITGNDPEAAKEAMKALYFTASLDDLRALCAKAAATEDAGRRKSIASICSRIATRIATNEALELVKPLQ
jgi:HEAT repeat protein